MTRQEADEFVQELEWRLMEKVDGADYTEIVMLEGMLDRFKESLEDLIDYISMPQMH